MTQDNDDTGTFEPLKALDELTENYTEDRPRRRPSELLVKSILIKPELFQPRHGILDQKHISDLVKALKSKGPGGKLDPILVYMNGDAPVVVDGHHRLEAYRRVERKRIRVEYFEGSPQEAVLEAGRRNSKVIAPMCEAERQEYAWKLVRLNCYSKTEIVKAASTGRTRVGYMRKTLSDYGDEVIDLSWSVVLFKLRGGVVRDKSIDEWKEAQAANFADRLQKTFGTKFAKHPEIAAMALREYFGDHLGELIGEMKKGLPQASFSPTPEGLDDFPF